MASYSVNDVKELRETTGAGMMEVKKALDEADGDKKRAIEIIRIKGLAKAAKRVDRETSEGLIAAKTVVCSDGECKGKTCGFIAKLTCETDFVAKSAPFIELAQTIIDAIAENKATDEKTALEAKVNGTTVQDLIAENSGVLGEKIELKDVAKVTGDIVGVYLHKKDPSLPPAYGSIVALDGKIDQDTANKVALHITSNQPSYITVDDIPADVIESETRVAIEKNPGKPEHIMPKIIEGFLKVFYEDRVLVEQKLIIDETKTVGQFIGDAKVSNFISYRVGE